ncbi:MAG TPA: glutamine--fructose-6-phosphate transaminase (isomerizing) [bacterium]|nr:glutamine--fructose-6-phosphate transaminase (isomerizing) [bacterium]HPQ66303.1 glutamine--fructose-6-phosphate transaminase (isomerizing) [bacterium]
MCGIVCYVGKKNATPILLEGLRRLEYRGYDSAGIAVVTPERTVMIKAVGKVADLEAKVDGVDPEGTMGIAHTRWATHGRVTEANAHPHTGQSGKLFLVHNGIIENFQTLKDELLELGHVFLSETDTEVLAHLIDEYYRGNLVEAVRRALSRVRGTFGIALFHEDEPRKIVLARRGSPLVLGIGTDELMAASDVTAMLRITKQIIHLDDNELAVLDDNDYTISDFQERPIEKSAETVEWTAEDADCGGFPHYMLKEIFEQPEAVENAIRGRLVEGEGVSRLGGLETVIERFKDIDRIIFVSCGTSYHAGMLATYIFERITDINVGVELASEFRYRNLRLDRRTAVIALSQSGETADTLAAIREAKRKGALVLGIVNVVGSTIARETDAGVYNHAGPEIGVASTKVFLSQCVILVLMGLLIARYQRLSLSDGLRIADAVKLLPDQIREILHQVPAIEDLARRYARYDDFLFIGRLYNYPIALEGALKLKEISYIHAEGYAAGEMKHGPISLIDPGFPTVALIPSDSSFDKMISNIEEIKSRAGKIVAVAQAGDERIERFADDVIYVPSTIDFLQPILNTVPLQLLAYYIALERDCDPDKPRNLAKSVTVE